MSEAGAQYGDADILFGDVATVTIAGEPVEVRELRWADGMRVMPQIAPIVESVRNMINDRDGGGDSQRLMDLLTQNADAWQALICASTGRDADWVASLSDQDGLTLQAAAWRANSAFFMRRPMLAEVMAEMLRRQGSPESSPTSSEADSEPITETSPSA